VSDACPFCVRELQGGEPSPLGEGETGGLGYVTEWSCEGCGAEIRRFTTLKLGQISDDVAVRIPPRYIVDAVVEDASYACPTCNGSLVWCAPVGSERAFRPPAPGDRVSRDSEWLCASCGAHVLRREQGTMPSSVRTTWFVTALRDGSQVFEPLERAPMPRHL
jgi:hypothetical protein